MGIPSVEQMEKLAARKGKTAKKGRSAKARLTAKYVYDAESDHWEKKVFDLSDPEQKAEADDALSPTQYRAEIRRQDKEEGSFTKSFQQGLGLRTSRAPVGKVSKAALKKAAKSGRSLGSLAKKAATSGAIGQAAKAVLPIALRLVPIAGAVGALWYLSKRAEDVQLQGLVRRYAENQEDFLDRKMTDTELKTYLPIWKQIASSSLTKARANAPAIKTLR